MKRNIGHCRPAGAVETDEAAAEADEDGNDGQGPGDHVDVHQLKLVQDGDVDDGLLGI